MATVYGTNATTLRSVPSEAVSPAEQHGRVRISYDTYTASGALSQNDVIKMGKLPAGARVVGYWLKATDLGTTGTLCLGHSASADGSTVAADDDCFLNDVDVNAAASTTDHAGQANMVGLGKKFDAAVDIEILVSAATTAAGTITSCVMYVLD